MLPEVKTKERENLAELDVYLEITLLYLRKKWFNPETGIEAASIIDGKNMATDTSYFAESKWRHAETNALTKYKLLYGEPSDKAICISTLAPCFKECQNRCGDSCVKVLLENKIKRIHFGAYDRKEAPLAFTYRRMGFEPTITQKPDLANTCLNLYYLYEDFPGLRTKEGNPWPEIKRIVYLNPFVFEHP